MIICYNCFVCPRRLFEIFSLVLHLIDLAYVDLLRHLWLLKRRIETSLDI